MRFIHSLTSILLLTLASSHVTTISAEEDLIPVPYTLCDPTPKSSGKPSITIDSVLANVWPPQPGKRFDVIATGSSSEDIQGGTYHVEVKLDDLTVLDKKGDLRDVGVTFPIKANTPTQIHKDMKIPQQIPEGDIVVTGHAYDQEKNELLCVVVTANMGEIYKNKKLGKVVIPNLSHQIGDVESRYQQQQLHISDAAHTSSLQSPIDIPVVDVVEIHIGGGSSHNEDDDTSIRSLIKSIVYDMENTMNRMRSQMYEWYHHTEESSYITRHHGHGRGKGKSMDLIDLSHLPEKSYPLDLTYPSNDDELHDLPYSLCGDENDPIQITSIKADNWPLVAGKPITMYVTAQVSKQVDNGVYEAKVLFDGLQVIDKKDTLEHLGVELPLKVGENKFHKKFDVPKNIPQGDVLLSAIAHTNEGEELMCATIEMHL